MAFIAPIVGIISAVSAVAGVGFTAIGMVTQAQAAQQNAKAQKQAYDYNAQVANNNAIAAEQQAKADTERIRRRYNQTLGKQRASAAGLGLLAGGGSFEDIQYDSLLQGELDAMNREYQGAVEANKYRNESKLQTFYGQTAISRGNSEATGSLLSGGAQIVGQVGELANRYAPTPTKSNPGFI
jgi:hypothetical protein